MTNDLTNLKAMMRKMQADKDRQITALTKQLQESKQGRYEDTRSASSQWGGRSKRYK